MVLFFTSASHPGGAVIYMGKDKVGTLTEKIDSPLSTQAQFENEALIKYAYPQDVWFHVDKLSSAHVYLRMPDGMQWTEIPEPLLVDCCQLVKANSIEGNKKNDLAMIYTPASNLKKTGDMAVGQVSFHKDKLVRRKHVQARDNVIVNRLNKTKVDKQVDHEGDRIARDKEQSRKRAAEANERKKAEQELARARKAEAESRSYDSLFTAQQLDKRERAQAKGGEEDDEEKDEGWDSDEDFM